MERSNRTEVKNHEQDSPPAKKEKRRKVLGIVEKNGYRKRFVQQSPE